MLALDPELVLIEIRIDERQIGNAVVGNDVDFIAGDVIIIFEDFGWLRSLMTTSRDESEHNS